MKPNLRPTVPLGDELVDVDLSAPGAWLALRRREYALWAVLAARRLLEGDEPRVLAITACAASLGRTLDEAVEEALDVVTM